MVLLAVKEARRGCGSGVSAAVFAVAVVAVLAVFAFVVVSMKKSDDDEDSKLPLPCYGSYGTQTATLEMMKAAAMVIQSHSHTLHHKQNDNQHPAASFRMHNSVVCESAVAPTYGLIVCPTAGYTLYHSWFGIFDH